MGKQELKDTMEGAGVIEPREAYFLEEYEKGNVQFKNQYCISVDTRG